MSVSRAVFDLYCRGANISNAGEPHMIYWRNGVWKPPWLPNPTSRRTGSLLVRGKNILFAGDSTTRDTFYQFVNVAGCPIFDRFVAKKTLTFPSNPMGRDAMGHCMGNAEKRIICARDVACNNTTRIYFRFTTKGSSELEMESIRALTNLTHAYVQCPVYEWLNPHVYNYSVRREGRIRASVPEDLFVPSVVRACSAYVSTLRRQNPHARIHLLGFASFPGWFRSHVNVSRLVQAVNAEFGIECANNALVQHGGVRPIDRYHTSKKHLRDGIHPTMQAQLAIVETILRLANE